MENVKLSLDDVREIAMRGLTKSNISESNATVIADVMTTAERDGCKSHGLFRMPGYCKSAKAGRANGMATPVVHDQAPGVVRVDTAKGFAAPAMAAGRPLLISKAKELGIASMGIIDAFHFAALWYDVDAIAEAGLVGFAFVNSPSYVAPAGGKDKLYGTNPMAFAWPRPGKPAVIFDQASSASARGEIQIHLRDGHAIPEGWGIDKDGRPSTDPAAVLDGAQLPFGGYKGSAIAMMVELMAVGLTGCQFGFEQALTAAPGEPAMGGELLIAIDPARLAPNGNVDEVLGRAEGLFERILAQPGTRLPSDRRYEARQHTPSTGIEIPQSLHDTIMALCES